jgi:hypothetical protein
VACGSIYPACVHAEPIFNKNILEALDARFGFAVELWGSVSVVVVWKYAADSAALAYDPHAKLRHAAHVQL